MASTNATAFFLPAFGTSNSQVIPFVNAILSLETSAPLSISAVAISDRGARATVWSVSFILKAPLFVFRHAFKYQVGSGWRQYSVDGHTVSLDVFDVLFDTDKGCSWN